METERRKRRFALAGLAAVLALTGLFCWFVGKPMLEFVSQPEQFRAWVNTHGIWGRLAFLGMMALQIVVAFLPGEPLEVGAGYAFGVWEGTFLCLLGAVLGSVIVFGLVKRFGMRFVTLFVPEEKIRSLKFLQNEKRLNLIAYLLFLIPGTPKDIMTYLAGLTPIRLPFWIFLTFTARIPSVITSTIGGDALGTQNYTLAAWAFVVTLLLSGAGFFFYRLWTRRKERREQEKEPERPAEGSRDQAA